SVRQRFDWDVACELTTYGVSDRWSARVRDISADGLGLVLDRSLDAGTVLEVEFTTNDGSLAYTVGARVSHSRAVREGEWLAGCTFVGRLSDEELRDLAV